MSLIDKILERRSVREYKPDLIPKAVLEKIPVLMHVVEEEIHHRGELLCIYWQHDIRPPYTSYMAYKGQV